MAETPKKKDRENKKRKNKMEKADKMKERKAQAKKGKSLDEMMAYVDENGNISATPPDPRKRIEINAEDIPLGVPMPREEQEELPRNGKVTFFDHVKGFGFIRDLATQQSVFVHVNDLSVSIKENDKVTFETRPGQRGPVAVNVKLTH